MASRTTAERVLPERSASLSIFWTWSLRTTNIERMSLRTGIILLAAKDPSQPAVRCIGS